MSLIKKIINDKEVKNNKPSNFNVVIKKESLLYVGGLSEDGVEQFNTKKLAKIISNITVNDIIPIIVNYLKTNIILDEFELCNDNIFIFNPKTNRNAINIRSLSFTPCSHVQAQPVTLDEKTLDGLSFGFVDDRFFKDGNYRTLDYSNDYIIPTPIDQGNMSDKFQDMKEDSDKRNLFNNLVIKFLRKNFPDSSRRPTELRKYDHLIKHFKLRYGINPDMLLYVKTYKNGYLNSNNDEPAVIWINGKKEWYKEGKLHRNNGPSVSYKTDSILFEAWYQNGKLNRNDHAAVTDIKTGDRNHKITEWWLNGFRHSTKEAPAYESGTNHYRNSSSLSIWWQYGLMHRLNKAAYISFTYYYGDITNEWKWYRFGKLHRINEPAKIIEVEYDQEFGMGVSSGGISEYWINGEKQPWKPLED